MATEDEFHAAAEGVKALPSDPGNDTKLQLYALYKQATEGDVQGKRPGFTNPVGRAKHDAWADGAGHQRRMTPATSTSRSSAASAPDRRTDPPAQRGRSVTRCVQTWVTSMPTLR